MLSSILMVLTPILLKKTVKVKILKIFQKFPIQSAGPQMTYHDDDDEDDGYHQEEGDDDNDGDNDSDDETKLRVAQFQESGAEPDRYDMM